MSTPSSEEFLRNRVKWIADHRALYIRSGGTQGHIMNLTSVSGRPFTPHCLIRHKGRKSGKTYINALVCGIVAGEVAIVGSKGGADRHPGWYHNITAGKTVDFQLATEAFRASWREPEGAEREKVWAYMADLLPAYDEYQAATARRIPVILMNALERIPVFSEADLD